MENVAALAAVLAALGGVVKLVLDALNKVDERHNATLREIGEKQNQAIQDIQARQEKFLGNHMSGNTKALNDLVEVVSQLVEEVQHGRD